MHKFYELPSWLKWTCTLVLFACFLGIVGLWFKLITIHFAFYLLIFLIAPFYHFTLTPLMTLTGIYKYLSPMLLVYQASPEQYDLHNGTGFDYFLHMRNTRPGRDIRRRLLIYYMEGLLKIIQEIESGLIPESIAIKGTSYFFSTATAKRFGFTTEPAPKDGKLNLYFNYFEILWMYALAQGRIALPPLKNIQMAKTSGQSLINNKGKIELYYNFLLTRSKK
ncbi:MAG: hypothetical protein HKN09_04305 [Saprospiraceae bacterium]|nr:hypothetical protein [Saprospiraceae bacterium]